MAEEEAATTPPVVETNEESKEVGDLSSGNVLSEADDVLKKFKLLDEKEFPNISSLYETAKNLYRESRDSLVHGKHEILNGKTTADDLDKTMEAISKKQEPVWEKLEAAEVRMRKIVDDGYKLVVEVEDKVKRERDDGTKSTEEQALVRRTYDKKLKANFQDAKMEHQKLCGFPDGLLTQVGLIKHRQSNESEIMLKDIHSYHLPKPTLQEEAVPEVVKEANEVLEKFKVAAEAAYPKISSLFESAKNLYSEVHENLTKGKHNIMGGTMTVDDLDKEMTDILMKQEPIWERLKEAEELMRKTVDDSYKEVVEVEDKVKHARGEGVNVAWLAIPTEEQALIRKNFNLKLKQNFQDAKSEHAKYCAFPEGLLTQLGIIRKRQLAELEGTIAQLRKRNQGHGGGLLGKIAHLVH